MRLQPLGDRAILVTLGNEISPRVHGEVSRALRRLRRAALPAITDMVPAFASIAIHYEPAAVDTAPTCTPYDSLARGIERCLAERDDPAAATSALIEIPVCYGGPVGPDLEDLAAAHGITPDQVVRLHAEPEYLVYMLGFLPGFAYLGGLSPRLATPRRASPRTHVPAGSVGIGGEQTGVYPLESPGGWHLIGRTPLRLFTPENDPPTLLRMGDRVRFRPVSETEFSELESSAR